MARYGEAAVWAARICVEEHLGPGAAWNRAAYLLNPDHLAAAGKNCPRTTFLSLCGEGYVRGVPRGRYANGRENLEHALALVFLLQEDEDMVDASTERLWKLAGGGGKHHDGQVDVVVALWRAGLIDRNAA